LGCSWPPPFGALAGLVAGGAIFVAARPLVEHVSVAGAGPFFAADVQPRPALAALIVALVPAAAIVATLTTLHGVAIEPLGVDRRLRPPRRRLLWRVAPTVLGLALLVPFVGAADRLTRSGGEVRAVVGVVLVLVGASTLLPWLVDAFVRRTPPGPVGWQLSVRRLQLDGGTAGRVVGGIGVAVAGGDRAADDLALRRTPGVRSAAAVTVFDARTRRGSASVAVGGCRALALLVEASGCRAGDVYLPRARPDLASPRPGTALRVAGGRLAVPRTARQVAVRPLFDEVVSAAVLMTPRALRGLPVRGRESVAFASLQPGRADAEDQALTAIAGVDPLARSYDPGVSAGSRVLRNLRRALFAGAACWPCSPRSARARGRLPPRCCGRRRSA
jgi:hypothetical protein